MIRDVDLIYINTLCSEESCFKKVSGRSLDQLMAFKLPDLLQHVRLSLIG
jgi:hypothetical protein